MFTLCVKIFSFLHANLAVILYTVMKNICLKDFGSSFLLESPGISSAERSFQFKAIQFNLFHLNTTLRDQPGKRSVLDTKEYTQINKTQIIGLKETNKQKHRAQEKEIFRNFFTNKIEMYTFGKYIEISKFLR